MRRRVGSPAAARAATMGENPIPGRRRIEPDIKAPAPQQKTT
jgi:hypothetical protein